MSIKDSLALLEGGRFVPCWILIAEIIQEGTAADLERYIACRALNFQECVYIVETRRFDMYKIFKSVSCNRSYFDTHSNEVQCETLYQMYRAGSYIDPNIVPQIHKNINEQMEVIYGFITSPGVAGLLRGYISMCPQI